MEKKFFDYNEIISKLNSGEILYLEFSIEGYAHYNHCKIYQIFEPIKCLQVKLTNDNYESIRFRQFNEKFKLFYFGKKGSYTLRQVWDKVRIIEIQYKE